MNQKQIWQAGKCSPGAVIPLLEEAMLAALPRGHALAGFSPGQEAPRIVSTLNLVAAARRVAGAGLAARKHIDTWCIAACAMQRSRGHLLLATRRWDGSAVVQRFVELVRRMAQEFATDGARAAG